MKRTLLAKFAILIILLVVFAQFEAAQTTVASWSFDALLAPTDAVPTASVINADYGALAADATIYLNGTNGSSTWISVTSSPELTTFLGSTVNDHRTVQNAGMALALANSSANGKSVIFKFSTSGYQNISLSFATRGTSTGFSSHSWEWSTDNVNYTAFGTSTANTTSTWLLRNLDLSGISAVNNASVVYIKLTVSGASYASGNNRIDNFVVSGIAPDITAPNPSFIPANAAVDVTVSVIPTITFDETIRKTDGSPVTDGDLVTLITFKKTDVSGADVPFTATIDAAKKVITVTPSSVLDNSQFYYLAIGPVEDEVGNESTSMNITFATIAAAIPTVTVTYPNGSEKLYSNDLVTVTWTTTNFDVGENVKIEIGAPDEALVWTWITLIVSTPNDGSEEVTVGPDAPYGTQYLIRISGVTNSATDQSDNPFTVIATATDLATLRQNPVDAIVKYKGVATITYARISYNQKYIQDATAAILIHDPTAAPGYITSTYDIGDGITNVEGKISLNNGLIELVPQATTGEPATGPAIVPLVVDITSLTQNDQCKLVKVQKLKFFNPTQYDATGLYVADKNYELAGLSNTTYVYRTNFAESDYIGTAVPTQYFNAIVFVGQYNTQMQITARSSADITLLSDAKAITSFDFSSPAATGTIDEAAKTVSLTVPSGTDVTALVPTIVVSAKANVRPASGVAQDFSSPVTYTVTAEDGTTQTYIVTVSVITGIEASLERTLNIFPNPASSELTTRNVQNVRSIEILDATGKVVMTVDVNDRNEIRIPISNLTRGLYFIKFTTDKGKVVKRFIKS